MAENKKQFEIPFRDRFREVFKFKHTLTPVQHLGDFRPETSFLVFEIITGSRHEIPI